VEDTKLEEEVIKKKEEVIKEREEATKEENEATQLNEVNAGGPRGSNSNYNSSFCNY
jgi:hypothetical protein